MIIIINSKWVDTHPVDTHTVAVAISHITCARELGNEKREPSRHLL
jgi:hypothetical protein